METLIKKCLIFRTQTPTRIKSKSSKNQSWSSSTLTWRIFISRSMWFKSIGTSFRWETEISKISKLKRSNRNRSPLSLIKLKILSFCVRKTSPSNTTMSSELNTSKLVRFSLSWEINTYSPKSISLEPLSSTSRKTTSTFLALTIQQVWSLACSGWMISTTPGAKLATAKTTWELGYLIKMWKSAIVCHY